MNQLQDIDVSGVWRGIVLDNNDPLKIGRLIVRVYSLYENLDINTIPFCYPVVPYGGNGKGFLFTPDIGDEVVVIFERNDIKRPMYIGSTYGMPLGINDVPLNHQGLPESTADVAAIDIDPLILENISHKAIYPFNRGIKSSSGLFIEMDDTPGEERLQLGHSSGSRIEFRNDGKLVVHAVGDFNLAVNGNCNIRIDGNVIINILGSVLKNILGSVIVNITGTVTKLYLSLYNVIYTGLSTSLYKGKNNITANDDINIISTTKTKVVSPLIELN